MNDGVFVAIVTSGVALSIPILWAALGEVINERAGILNIGIEGVMLFGAFAAAITLKGSDSFVLAFLVAVPVGLVAGAVLAWFYVTRGTDQIVTGIIFNLFALGLTTVLYNEFLTGAGTVRGIGGIDLPGLADLPLVGPVLFDQTLVAYAAVLVAVLVFLLLKRTWLGLYLRGIGERPRAGDTAGLSVIRLRYIALLVACPLVALGGASIIITQGGNFLPNVTSGQGFIALAVVVLGRFNPLWIVGGAFLFGLSTALQFQAQNLGLLSDLPAQLWLALPYIVTIIAVVVAKGAQYPAATAIPYTRPGTAER
jgi:simple sugar transport system permease protein